VLFSSRLSLYLSNPRMEERGGDRSRMDEFMLALLLQQASFASRGGLGSGLRSAHRYALFFISSFSPPPISFSLHPAHPLRPHPLLWGHCGSEGWLLPLSALSSAKKWAKAASSACLGTPRFHLTAGQHCCLVFRSGAERSSSSAGEGGRVAGLR